MILILFDDWPAGEEAVRGEQTTATQQTAGAAGAAGAGAAAGGAGAAAGGAAGARDRCQHEDLGSSRTSLYYYYCFQ